MGGGTINKSFKIVPGLTLVKLPTGLTVKDALKTFNKTDGILYAEPNYRVKALSTFPNDTYFTKQWHLHNTGQNPPGGTSDADIDAPEGWDIQTGSSEIIVAVIDTGVDYEHEDLEDNMWINEAELNGVEDEDDDENGYVDDIYGYDFYNDDADPIDDEGHGTACAGLVGAVGNNSVGVTGVCWNVKIMAVKFLGAGGGSTADAIDSVQYADLMDARVMSNSWGGGGYSEGLEDAIQAAKANGAVFVASSGNWLEGGPVLYPAKYAEAIAVGATDEDDAIWYYSGHGPELDVVAPSGDLSGQGNLWTTDITGEGNGYDNRDPLIFDYTDKMGGTSGAAPQVAGLAALILSINPDFSPDEVQFIIESTADDVDSSGGWDQYYGWGRINSYRSLIMVDQFPFIGWWKLDETEGTEAEDSIGDNDGTLNNFPIDDSQWVTGWINGALEFDGSDDYVSLDSIYALTTDTVTISAWIKTDTMTGSFHPIVSTYEYVNPYHYGYLLYIGKNTDPVSYEPIFYLAANYVESNVSINITDWYHIAGTYDGSDLKIYVNGELENTTSASGLTGFYEDYDSTYIGYEDNIPTVGAVYFDGKIDDVRVYNSALDTFEIWDAMTGDLSRFRVNDSSGDIVAWFDNLGNLFLKGTLVGVDPLEEDPAHDEFRVRDSSSDDIAIIDSTNGNMYISGLHKNWNTPSAGKDEFIIRDAEDDPVAYINDDGNLYLKGELYQNP